MSIVVVVPSRGRPKAARDTLAAIRNTAALISTRVIVAVDADDPAINEYIAMGRQEWQESGLYAVECSLIVLQPDETGDLVRATNTISRRVAAEDPDAIIGNLGDDHRPRTFAWDRIVTAALDTPGMAYGDDLLHGERLPSAPFVSARLVNALGWYFLPALEHMYVDDAWRELARAAGIIRYLPQVVFEHLHPGAGKAEWDEGYLRAKDGMERDRERYEAWLTGDGFVRAIEAVMSVV